METVQIECRCKDCEYYECVNNKWGNCYYWDYEVGMSPNGVDEDDFCSNAVRKDK